MSYDVSRLRYRGGSFSCLPRRLLPSPSPSRHLMPFAWLADVLPAYRPVVISSSSRHLVPSIVSSSHCLGRLLACLLGASARPSSHQPSRAILLACRSSPPPCGPSCVPPPLLACSIRSPVGHRRPVRSLPVPARACCHRSPRSACRTAGSGTGRGARHRLSILPPLLVFSGVVWLRLFRLRRSACLLGRRVDLCLYCGGEIVYMICPVVII